MGRRRKRTRNNNESPSPSDKKEKSRLYSILEKITNYSNNKSSAIVKGTKAFKAIKGYKYKFKFPKSGVLNIIDTTLKSAKGRKNVSVIRFDRPHPKLGINTNHININPKVSGIKDPHIPLPSGSLAVRYETKLTIHDHFNIPLSFYRLEQTLLVDFDISI